jgi:hypothetical protein
MLATVKDESDDGKKDIQSQLEKMKKYCTVIRVLAHTQVFFSAYFYLILCYTLIKKILIEVHIMNLTSNKFSFFPLFFVSTVFTVYNICH